MTHVAKTLGDLGEMRLIDEVILPLSREFDVETDSGNDCAYFSMEGGTLAVTADVGPKPLLHNLPGYERDFEAAGWLAVVATASDVATAGARPFYLTNCIDAPPDLSVADFAVYLRGYFKACAAFGFRNGGGDVRHGPALEIRVFGAGVCAYDHRLGRSGAKDGDRLVVVGPAGVFMATYLLAASQCTESSATWTLTPEAETILKYPWPQLKEMQLLAEQRVLSAASDTSDGLIGAIDNLARSSQCGFELHLDNTLLPQLVVSASAGGINPWNIFFAWGDWSVACAIPIERFPQFKEVCERHSISWTLLGRATAHPRQLTARVNGGPLVSVATLRNENFVTRGFNAGLAKHLDFMLSTQLFKQA